jgi:hypothetical protein
MWDSPNRFNGFSRFYQAARLAMALRETVETVKWNSRFEFRGTWLKPCVNESKSHF